MVDQLRVRDVDEMVFIDRRKRKRLLNRKSDSHATVEPCEATTIAGTAGVGGQRRTRKRPFPKRNRKEATGNEAIRN
jgi:hypothetical protein